MLIIEITLPFFLAPSRGTICWVGKGMWFLPSLMVSAGIQELTWTNIFKVGEFSKVSVCFRKAWELTYLGCSHVIWCRSSWLWTVLTKQEVASVRQPTWRQSILQTGDGSCKGRGGHVRSSSFLLFPWWVKQIVPFRSHSNQAYLFQDVSRIHFTAPTTNLTAAGNSFWRCR